VAYETLIGWRYVYRGRSSSRAKLGVVSGVLLTVLGLALYLGSGGSSATGVFTLAGGMLVTLVSTLLYYLSVFTTVSLLGVILGVAALTVVLAVTTGFQEQFREKVLGVNAHVIIMKNTADFAEYRDVEKVSREIDPDVLAVQPFIFVEMLVTRGKGELSGVAIKGIDPERINSVLDLHKHIVVGSVDSLKERPKDEPPPIILGQELAHKLKAQVGDTLTVVAPLSNVDVTTWTATGDAPKSREFKVSGIFYSGFDEYDRRLMYINIAEAQDLLGQGDQVMGVELKVRDVNRAAEIADAIDAKLGGSPYVVQDWHELNRNLFTALTMQKMALVIILTIIILVAAFNMVSALTMMVIDKTREVAILKSMGATSSGIARVFQVVGITIGGVGTVFGLGLGLVLCKVVADYDYRLDPKVYLIDRLPIAVHPEEIALVGVLTLVIAALATLVPSYRAAALRPVEGLRHD